MLCRLFMILGLVAVLTSPVRAAAPAPTTQAISFTRDVAPVLVAQCQGCHGPEKAKGNYRLDTFERLMKTGESKTAPVVAGDVAKSQMFRLITSHDEDERMPKKADALPAGQVASILRWIEAGA